MPKASVGGDEIYYEIYGEGEPVIFISGLGSDHTLWHWQVAEYSKEFQCIFFDNRGVGESTISPHYLNEDRLTMELLSEDVAGLMEQLEIEKAHIVGASMGGIIAQYFALAHPEKVITLSLHSTLAKSSPLVNMHFKTQIDLLQRLSMGELLISLAPVIWAEETLTSRLDLLKEFRSLKKDSVLPISKALYILQAHSCLYFDLLSQISKIDIPVLVTAGAEDILIHPRNSILIHHTITGSKYIEFEGCGHAALMEKHKEFNLRTMDFIRKRRKIK
ncbi:MAG: alpha/beta hydrolase [Spirochaetales bacterium]|nr:alpha/beta hydrolase [Spirochaetales bacterium]